MSFVRDPQYTVYDNTLAEPSEPLPFTKLPPAGWQPETSENIRLLMLHKIQTNADYRKFVTEKSVQLQAKNLKEYADTL